jgi:hypothetical protein
LVYKFSGFSYLEKGLSPLPKEKLPAVPMATLTTQKDIMSDRIVIGGE